MAKRFTSTDIWEEDWFLDMPSEYKLFWYYILSACNHAGIYKVNVKSFCRLNDLNLTPTKALEYFNNGKQRIRVVSDSVWLIEDFFVYQYGNTLNRGNRVHKSIEVAYNQSDIDLTSIRGLKVVLEGSKRPQNVGNDGVKDKDKDKDIIEEGGVGEEDDFENLNQDALAPKMVRVFREFHPKYPIDTVADCQACLEMAYKIAKANGWTKESATNGRMNDVLKEWRVIAEFTKTDKWYKTRSLTDINKEYQRLIQSINKKDEGNKESIGRTFEADKL